MRPKITVVLMVIGLMLLWLCVDLVWLGAEPNNQATAQVRVSNVKPSINKDPLIVTGNKEQLSILESLDDLLYKEVSQSDLNEDPYLAALAVQSRLRQCKQIDFDEKLSKRANYEELKPLIQQYDAQCLYWTEQYPVLSSNLQQINSIPATSEKGKSLKAAHLRQVNGKLTQTSQLEGFQQAQENLNIAQQSGDLEALRGASQGMMNWSVALRRPEQDVIGGGFIYVRNMADITLRLLGCQNDILDECAPTSYFMMSTCLEVPAACGLSYPQWADRFLTPGMKMDVEALMAYYSQNMD